MARMTTSELRAGLFGPADRVALIAGSGQLPVDLAAGLAKAGNAPFVIMIGGEAVDRSAFETYEHRQLAPEEVGKLVPLLKRSGITHVVMAGGVSRRPSLRKIKWNLPLLISCPM